MEIGFGPSGFILPVTRIGRLDEKGVVFSDKCLFSRAWVRKAARRAGLVVGRWMRPGSPRTHSIVAARASSYVG